MISQGADRVQKMTEKHTLWVYAPAAARYPYSIPSWYPLRYKAGRYGVYPSNGPPGASKGMARAGKGRTGRQEGRV